MNDVTYLLLFRTLTRDSYESGISYISRALNTNEAMVMVSISSSCLIFINMCYRIYKLTFKNLIGQVLNKYLKRTVCCQIWMNRYHLRWVVLHYMHAKVYYYIKKFFLQMYIGSVQLSRLRLFRWICSSICCWNIKRTTRRGTDWLSTTASTGIIATAICIKESSTVIGTKIWG